MNSVNRESRKQFLELRKCKYSVGTPKENFDECMKDCRKHIIHYLNNNVKLYVTDKENKMYDKIQHQYNEQIIPLNKLIDDFKKYRVLDYHATLNKMGYDSDGYCFHDFATLIYDEYGDLFSDKHEVYSDINCIACDYRLIAGLYGGHPDIKTFEHCNGYGFRYFEFQ